MGEMTIANLRVSRATWRTTSGRWSLKWIYIYIYKLHQSPSSFLLKVAKLWAIVLRFVCLVSVQKPPFMTKVYMLVLKCLSRVRGFYIFLIFGYSWERLWYILSAEDVIFVDFCFVVEVDGSDAKPGICFITPGCFNIQMSRGLDHFCSFSSNSTYSIYIWRWLAAW